MQVHILGVCFSTTNSKKLSLQFALQKLTDIDKEIIVNFLKLNSNPVNNTQYKFDSFLIFNYNIQYI